MSSLAVFKKLFLVCVIAVASLAFGQDAEVEMGINERLGEQIRTDFHFMDENGDSVSIADLLDKPVIFNFVYFRCPGICSPLLDELIKALNRLDLRPGEDFKIITISINSDEQSPLALEKKQNYMKMLLRFFPDNQWHWLTGDSSNIAGITGELGFAFKQIGKDFAHPAVIMTVSQTGKISRYLYLGGGSRTYAFNHFDLKMSLIEAREERFGPSIAQVLKLCFSYDPQSRSYVFNFMKISGSFVLLMMFAFLLYLTIKGKKVQPKRG